jgi:hypothetical protein
VNDREWLRAVLLDSVPAPSDMDRAALLDQTFAAPAGNADLLPDDSVFEDAWPEDAPTADPWQDEAQEDAEWAHEPTAEDEADPGDEVPDLPAEETMFDDTDPDLPEHHDW